jgi:hypothetical protein
MVAYNSIAASKFQLNAIMIRIINICELQNLQFYRVKVVSLNTSFGLFTILRLFILLSPLSFKTPNSKKMLILF